MQDENLNEIRTFVPAFFYSAYQLLRDMIHYCNKLRKYVVFVEEIVRCDQVDLIVNIKDVAGSIIARCGVYEMNEYEKFIDSIYKDSIVVDVGASYGQYALNAAVRAKKGLVLAFEPNPLLYLALVKSTLLNNLDNVICLPYALADREGTATLHIPNTHAEGATLFEEKLTFEAEPKFKNVIKIFTILKTLDGVLYELGIKPCNVDVVKIDAEGAEFKILRGMRRVLNDSEALTLLLEFCPHMIKAAGDDPRELLELLTDYFPHIECIPGGARITKENIDEMLEKIVYTNLYCTKRSE